MVQPQYQHPGILFDQVNIRTYTIDPVTEKPFLYTFFIHCGISGGLITYLYRALSGMLAEHTPVFYQIEKAKDGVYVRYDVSGRWHGLFTIDAEEVSNSPHCLVTFPNAQNAKDYLIDPLVGFYSDGPILRRLEIYHDPLIPRVCKPAKIIFPYLTQLGIVPENEIAIPHSILLIPFTPFLIYLPARAFVNP